MEKRVCEQIRIGAPGDLNSAVHRAAVVLGEGGVLLYPTDTLYGFGCLAGDVAAVRRIYAIKGKPESKPSLVLVDSVEMAIGMSDGVSPLARHLMDIFWPGPLTLILRAAPGVEGLLTAGTGKLGVRLPADEFCRRLSTRCASPLVSTSANRSGVQPEGDYPSLLREFGGEVDLAVDGGVRRSAPSTIADVSDGTLTIVREGAVSALELTRAISGRP